MSELRNAWHKQCAAMMKRADTDKQLELARALRADDATESEILIQLERKFFINRKQSTEILLTISQ